MDDYDEWDCVKIILAFLRRTVIDASGGDRKSGCTLTDQSLARTYLTDGRIVMWGYYQYNHCDGGKAKKRTYEKNGLEFVVTESPQYSPITLYDILEYFGLDRDATREKIQSWADSNWSRNHEFYKNMIKATKNLEA